MYRSCAPPQHIPHDRWPQFRRGLLVTGLPSPEYPVREFDETDQVYEARRAPLINKLNQAHRFGPFKKLE